MSSIGSGPGLGSGSQLVGSVRPVSTADVRAAPTPVAQTETPAAQAASASTHLSSTQAATIATSTARDAGPVPVDSDRVKVIKKAIETGSYPVVPAKISDAMIAAGLLLRNKR